MDLKAGPVAATIIDELTTAQAASADITQLLSDSKAAHQAYRYALSLNQFTEAKLQLAKAADYRSQAASADPDFLAPAWNDLERTHPHKELTEFYASELAK